MRNVMVMLSGWRTSPRIEKILASLGGRTIAMLAAALVISIASIIFNDNWILSIARQDVLIAQIRTNIVTLNTARTNLYSAESAQRGYLLTQRAEYLEPYKLALREARRNIQTINDLAVKTLDQSSLDKLDKEHAAIIATTASLEAKATEMKVILAFIERDKLEEAKQVMDLDSGMQDMHTFMTNTQLLIDQQSKNLDTLLLARRSTMMLARISLISGALILILLVVLVIKQLLKEISVKSHLQAQLLEHNMLNNQKLEQQSKLLSGLAFEYLSDVERERHELSRELHDEMGAILTATKMDVAWVMKKLKDDSPDIAEKLKKTNTYIDQGINLKREIVEKLHPSVISTLGFWPALQLLIDDAVERNLWQLSLNMPDKTPKLNDTIGLIAYRIVQETLNNASKYAKASAITIDIMLDEKMLKLNIQDNGIGFDVGILGANKHGLAGMRHRVISIGGHFEILSAANEGTITRVLLPADITK